MGKLRLALVLGFIGSWAWAGGFGFGFLQATSIDTGDLNTFLRENNQPEIDRKLGLDFGGGGYFVKEDLLLGLEGGSLSMVPTERGGKEVSLGGGYLTFNLGYGLLKREKSFVYTNIGLGYSAMTLAVKEQEGTLDTYKVKDLEGVVGKLGIGYIRRLSKLFIGAEIGGIHPLSGLDAEGNKIGTTFFLRFLIGGGSF